MSDDTASLHLRSGHVIEDPLADALRFIKEDGTYQRYDLLPAGGDDLTEADVRAANSMIARMGKAEAAAVLSRRDDVRAALTFISPSTTLTQQFDIIPWDRLQNLYGAFEGLRGVGVARATKLLHKKRPALIPILDDVVARYLVHVEGPMTGDLAARGLALTRAYHRELHYVLPALAYVRAELAQRRFQLTECRLLDIYLWAYSSTYAPLWKRPTNLQRRSADRAPSERGSDRPQVSLPLGVERFVNDDAGYIHWLGMHPNEYVLNCHHRPQPSYLKLHRASCGHLSRAGVTNWTGAYAKVCSSKLDLLDHWATAEVDALPDRCPVCRP